MYYIEIPKGINNLKSLFYYLGFWHRGDKATVTETRLKLFYCLFQLLLPISLLAGVIDSNNRDESIFLTEGALASCVLTMKLFYIIWKKDQILEMLTRFGVYSMENREEFNLVNNKLKSFMKFATLIQVIAFAGAYAAVLAPIFVNERKLFLNFGFPLDWKNNKVAFWLANAFIFFSVSLTIMGICFSIIIWYLMINSALRLKILGSKIKNMGVRPIEVTTNELKLSVVEKQNLFLRGLIAAIDSHQYCKTEVLDQMKLFLSKMFLAQIFTSGLCICSSIYCLAFNVGENLVEGFVHFVSLLYNVAEIFMIMYLGNEIKVSSDGLSYCLFESNWIDQPQKTKNLIIIFGELIKQPDELVIGYLYPLTLEMFRRIMNFAYNSFNILKNLK